VLKTIIFLLQVGFTSDFVPYCPFKLCFWQFKLLTPLFYLTVPKFVVFFRLLNRKFNEDSKNVLKTVIFLLQVDFTGDFVPNCVSGNSNFDTAFLPDCTKFCSVFQVTE